MFGNRGCLHDASGSIVRQYSGKRWIACRLEFRGRRRPVIEPGRYTALFFLDEVTAFAAGHRPCAECRHEDYVRFRASVGIARADDIDARLHAERWPRRTYKAEYKELPDGAFVEHGATPHLVLGGALLRWTPAGYADPVVRPSGAVAVITPPTFVEVLGKGWQGSVPLLHPTAATLTGR